MTVSAQSPVISYTATGSATEFAFPFFVIVASDLKVYFNNTEVTTGFTVAGTGVEAGGTVTFTSPPANGTVVKLLRSITLDRTTDYVEGGPLRSVVLDADFDRTVMMIQDIRADAASLVEFAEIATTVTTQAGIATTQAGIATTQAGIATTQAGIATTQAGAASTSAGAAAASAIDAENRATNFTVADDTATNSTMYPLWVAATSGNTPLKLSSTKITFNPSTGTLTASTFAGALSGNATTATASATSTIADDTTTNATMYPVWVTAATGNLPAKVTSTKMTFNPSTGTLSATGFNSTSTKRVKKAVKPLRKSYVAKFSQLRPVEYDRKDYIAHEFGFIAEEMALVYPEIVGIGSDGLPSGIDYGKLSTILIAKVQQQEKQIEQILRVLKG